MIVICYESVEFEWVWNNAEILNQIAWTSTAWMFNGDHFCNSDSSVFLVIPRTILNCTQPCPRIFDILGRQRFLYFSLLKEISNGGEEASQLKVARGQPSV